MAFPQPVVGRRAEWSPTRPIFLGGGLAAAAGANTAQIRLRPLSGSWQVDDFYVDPFARY
jgi:hypothetical protein